MRIGRDRRLAKTREVPREERARAFGFDPASGSHQGQQPKRLHSKAEYMAAPERLAELSDSPCNAGAVHTCVADEADVVRRLHNVAE